MQETHMGEDGVGKTKNNVCGIYNSSAQTFYSYTSIEEGLAACEAVVLKYEPWTIYQMSRRWTMTEQDFWYNNVTYYYNQ